MEKRQETERLPIHRHDSNRLAELEHAVVSASAGALQVETKDAVMCPQERLGQSLQDKRDEVAMGLDEIVRITKIPKASLLHIEAGRFDSLPGDVFARGFLRSYARCVGLDGDEVVRRYAQCGLSPAPVSSALADAVLGGRRKQPTRRARGTSAPEPETSPRTRSVSGGTDLAPVDVVAEEAPSGSADGNAVRKVLRDAFDLGMQLRSGRDRDVPKNTSRAVRAKRAEEVSSEFTELDTQASNAAEGASAATAPQCAAARERRVRTFVPPSFDGDGDMTHRGPLTLGVIILVIVATLTMSYLLRRPGASTDGFTRNEPATLDRAGQGAVPMTAPGDLASAHHSSGAQRA